MSDPHAITAGYRVTYKYTVNGLTHKSRVYTKEGNVIGGSLYITGRSGGPYNLIAENAAAVWAAKVAANCGTPATGGSALWERRDGLLWSPVESSQPTFTPGGTAYTVYAQELTAVMYDTQMNRFKIVLTELAVYVPQHSTDYLGGSAALDDLFTSFTIDGGVGHEYDPYNWMTSKYGHNVRTSGFISFTTTYNRKLRRARGYA